MPQVSPPSHKQFRSADVAPPLGKGTCAFASMCVCPDLPSLVAAHMRIVACVCPVACVLV